MKKKDILHKILEEKIIAILRLNSQDHIPKIFEHLIKGGIRVLEITSNTPGYLEEISNARNAHKNILIGAGTVTNSSIAKKAIKHGAQFLVTPNFDAKIIKIAHKNNVPVIMGALTPSEIVNSIEAKADIIKLFPANSFGIDYFKAIKGPFSDTIFFAVGGIGLENAKAWLNAGVSGIGLGGSLVKDIENAEDLQNITKKAIEFKALL